LTDELAAFHPDAACNFQESFMRHAERLGEVPRGDFVPALHDTGSAQARFSKTPCVIVRINELTEHEPLRC